MIMKPPTVILALLAGAFVLGDVAAVMYVDSSYQRWPDLAGVVLLGAAFGQLTLLAAWAVFANWNIAVRILLAVLVVLGLSFVAARATIETTTTQWFATLLVATCSLAVPMAITRCFRARINLKNQTARKTRMPAWQFSIWGLLTGTTAVAIALGTARQVDMPLTDVGKAAGIFTCIAVAGLLTFFTAMGIRVASIATVVTVVVVAAVCPLCGQLMGAAGLSGATEPQVWMLFGWCYGATIAISAIALRVAGYRLVRGDRSMVDVEALASRDDVSGHGNGLVELPMSKSSPETPDDAARPSLAIHPKPDD